MKILRTAAFAVALAVTPAMSVAGASDAATPAQDLDCAVWAANLAGSTSDKQMLMGAATLNGYFTGRYEATTQTDIDDAMFARSTTMTDAEMPAIERMCQARAKRYGDRLTILGKRIVAEAEAQKKR